MVNLARSRQSAHELIARWSGGKKGYLVRDGARRVAITCALRDYRPTERGQFLDKSVAIHVSCVPADPVIDYEQDQIEFAGKIYSILQPPGGPRPDGSPVFYDCNCVYARSA